LTIKEKQIINKIIEYTRIYKPLNPADIAGVVNHSHYSHYENEYLEEVLQGLVDGKDIETALECLKDNFEEFIHQNCHSS
jgi:hypothetical protein